MKYADYYDNDFHIEVDLVDDDVYIKVSILDRLIYLYPLYKYSKEQKLFKSGNPGADFYYDLDKRVYEIKKKFGFTPKNFWRDTPLNKMKECPKCNTATYNFGQLKRCEVCGLTLYIEGDC